MTAPDGPHPVSSRLQVRLPIRLARRLHIEGGDLVYWRISDDLPDVLQLLPEEVVERRYSAGERLEAAEHEVGQELIPGNKSAKDEKG
ncbi:AbrB/MazE/SpoVT family DNA-binding domain-containing protein [Mycobacterium intracellulare]|uniref:AbrB/MazE/SpoVT family DNA-binding domain-containing protein n=1 Tax=Mycobacterium intracellulare TaxID=1767 RepID=UPI00080BCD80|nr:AbrB/MazE/SpoVT family DNA-binding domain-containing protein [Mycobacterium intracellulare]OCB27053.1 hypothetical protein A5689_00565 [Mycobacterium intracellulare subsp. yongonense]